jgi:hypothetical protein
MKHVIITGSSRGIGFGLAKTIEIDEDILPRELPSLSSPVADFIAKHDTVSSVMRWSLLSIVALQLGPTASIALFVLLFALMSTTAVLVFRRMVVRRQT